MTLPETIEECERLIDEKHQLMKQMVGWLYPSILQREIDELSEHKYQLYLNQRTE